MVAGGIHSYLNKLDGTTKMTTTQDIEEWFKQGVKRKATHMVIVCDSFSYEDYPVYVSEGEDVKKVLRDYNQKEMQRVMEVYNLKMSMAEQLREHRSFNY